jgi:NAD(P)-dependent dehydrogenase (short-subunit alcohol dehydrogenase family)
MRTLENKVVIITGAGSGFGRALAQMMADAGAIPILADMNPAGLDETAALLDTKRARYGKHILDIRNREQWQSIAAAVEQEFGGIDVLVNNAGIMSRSESFLELPEDHCRLIFEVNFWGMYYGIQTMMPYLAKRPEAHIVNVASTLAMIGNTLVTIYCASKAAVASYTQVLHEELRGTKINVSLVLPGVSRTNLGRNVPTDTEDQREANTKNFEKIATAPPEKVARAMMSAILRNRRMVATGVDGMAFSILQRISPALGYRLMGKVNRSFADPRLFATLDALK